MQNLELSLIKLLNSVLGIDSFTDDLKNFWILNFFKFFNFHIFIFWILWNLWILIQNFEFFKVYMILVHECMCMRRPAFSCLKMRGKQNVRRNLFFQPATTWSCRRRPHFCWKLFIRPTHLEFVKSSTLFRRSQISGVPIRSFYWAGSIDIEFGVLNELEGAAWEFYND